MAKKYKRDSSEIDKLIAEVERLVANGMSVNKACHKVGLQTTVYYFRKRKEQASEDYAPVSKSRHSSVPANYPRSENVKQLMDEYHALERKLHDLKIRIAETMLHSKET